MRVRRRLLPGLAVLLLVALASVVARGPSDEGVDPGVDSDRRPTARAPALLARGGAAAPREGAAPSPHEVTRVLGVVRRACGAPAAGAAILLYRAGASGPPSPYFGAEVVRSAAATCLGVAGDREPPPPAWEERRATRTLDDGTYVFRDVPAAGRAEVVAHASGARTASRKAPLGASVPSGKAPVEVRLDFDLVERPEVRLRLLSDGGAPLAGVLVALYVRASYDDGTAAPFGWALAAERDGEPPSACEVVRHRAGGPSTATTRVVARTDARGVVVWRPVQAGAWRACAHVAGHRPFVADGVVSEPEGPHAGTGLSDLGDVRLDAELSVGDGRRARLVVEGGAPAAGRVLALTTADEFQSEVPGTDADGLRRTDDDGWFSLANCADGALHHVWVHARGPGGRLARVRARLEPGVEVRLPEDRDAGRPEPAGGRER